LNKYKQKNIKTTPEMRKLFPKVKNELALGLLHGLLRPDYTKRFTVDDALRDVYFTSNCFENEHLQVEASDNRSQLDWISG
jgi:hypothetical protein